MANLFECLPLVPCPSWARDEGLWYVSATTPQDGSPTPMYRHLPRVSDICGPLMGNSIYGAERRIVGVSYPAHVDACRIYREALELVRLTRDPCDLLVLAMYRRQICADSRGLFLDLLFLELAEALVKTPEAWGDLALRMPEGTPLARLCHANATRNRFLAAAE